VAYDPRAQFSPGTPMYDPRASAGQNISGMAQGRAPMNPTSQPRYEMGRQAIQGANNMRQQRQTQVPGTFQVPSGPAPFRQEFGQASPQPPGMQTGQAQRFQQAVQRRFPMATSFQRQGQEARQMQQQRQAQQGQQMQRRGIPQNPEQASQLGWSIGNAIRQLLDQMGTGGMA